MDQQLLRRDFFIIPGDQKFHPSEPSVYLCANRKCFSRRPLLEVMKPPKEVDRFLESSYNRLMLSKLLGSETAMKIMLHLIHYGEIYPTAVAKDYQISLSAVQKQFQRFEGAGVVVSKLVGKSRVYIFNKKSPVTKPFIELVKTYYDGLSLEDKEKMFGTRRRPRRPGKPVLKKAN